MKKTIFSIAMLLVAFYSQAQNYVHQVIVLNEGHYDYTNNIQLEPVIIGTYDPVAKTYHPFDTIPNSRFATDVIIDGTNIYVAADSAVLMYDANTYALLHQVTVRGVRKLAIWNNQLLVSRGEYAATYNSYFQVFNKTNLAFIYDLPIAAGPMYATEKIVVKDDSAYVAVGNGFDFGNYKGLIGVVNLNAQTYSREITLADTATNPENMMLAGNDLVTVNNNDFSKSSVSTVGIGTAANATKLVVSGSGCSTSALATVSGSHYVLYQAFGNSVLGKYDVAAATVVSPININRQIYGIAVNPINNEIYTGVTDFATFGKVYIHYANGFPRDSFNVTVSPGNMAFDIRLASGINNIANEKTELKVLNTLATDELQIVMNTTTNQPLAIVNVTGQTVMNVNYNAAKTVDTINISALPAGVYFINTTDNTAAKFMKQ